MPNQLRVRCVAWDQTEDGWIAVGGQSGMLKVIIERYISLSRLLLLTAPFALLYLPCLLS